MFLCRKYPQPVMSPGAPVYMIYDGPAEMMACSSPCLDCMRFFRSGESKKTERLLRFKDRWARPLLSEPCRRLICDKCLHLTLEFVSPDTMSPDYEPALNIMIHTYLQVVWDA